MFKQQSKMTKTNFYIVKTIYAKCAQLKSGRRKEAHFN